MNTSPRRASTLLEAMVACMVLGTALALTARLSGLATAHAQAAEHRACAAEEAANLMERIAALPAESRTAEGLATWELSAAAAKLLPSGRLTIQVAAVKGQPPAQRVTIEIRWRNRAGQDDVPVRLAAWFYPEGSP